MTNYSGDFQRRNWVLGGHFAQHHSWRLMSEVGQSRRFECALATSAVQPIADITLRRDGESRGKKRLELLVD
jgi:hypothetical protein